jgi:hypothetical protein
MNSHTKAPRHKDLMLLGELGDLVLDSRFEGFTRRCGGRGKIEAYTPEKPLRSPLLRVQPPKILMGNRFKTGHPNFWLASRHWNVELVCLA